MTTYTDNAPVPTDFCITNGRLVTPERILDPGGIRIESGVIVDIWEGRKPCRGGESLDARGCLLLPGFVDIHADSLETAIAPRPSAPFDTAAVMPTYDAELAMHGITTVFHCVGLGDLGDLSKPLRNRTNCTRILMALREFAPSALLRSRIHLRYEITDTESLPLVQRLVADGLVDLVSIMDHTPGFGVFKDLDAYRTYYERSGHTAAAADERFNDLLERREHLDEVGLRELVRNCLHHSLTVVSHDDHTAEKLQWALDLGVSVAEFPVTLEAVDFARAHDMQTVFGTPNLMRGVSHAGNLKVADMVATNRADILCLDYAPMCSLPALFKAAKINGNTLSRVSRIFSLNPARSVGLADVTGSVEIGKSGDLIMVDDRGRVPRVLATFAQGRPVYRSISTGVAGIKGQTV